MTTLLLVALVISVAIVILIILTWLNMITPLLIALIISFALLIIIIFAWKDIKELHRRWSKTPGYPTESRIALSFALSLLGIIPFFNVLLIFPYCFYLGWQAYRLLSDTAGESISRRRRRVLIILAALAMLSAAFWWTVSIFVFIMVSFGFWKV